MRHSRKLSLLVGQCAIITRFLAIAYRPARWFKSTSRGPRMDGVHLLGEWCGCPADTPEFTRAGPLRELCVGAALAAGLIVVGECFHQFEPQGVTGTVLLAESHIAIHTWPEEGFVTVDVYVCNLQTDNTAKAEHVFYALERALKPTATHFASIRRGGLRA